MDTYPKQSCDSLRQANAVEEIEMTAENLETLLEEDATFVEFFNAFLALPMFPVRLYYNPDATCFEEFKHKLADDVMNNNAKKATKLKRFSFFKSTIDDKGFKIGYYVKFLSKIDGFKWVKKNRFPQFLQSELCAEYKLARVLSDAQTFYLMNILIDAINIGKSAFDEKSSPQYRIQRNNGRLPGLAEFQERMNLLQEASESSGNGSPNDTTDSEQEEIEFSRIATRCRNNDASENDGSSEGSVERDTYPHVDEVNHLENELENGNNECVNLKVDETEPVFTQGSTNCLKKSVSRTDENISNVKRLSNNNHETEKRMLRNHTNIEKEQVDENEHGSFNLQDHGILSVMNALKKTYENATGLSLEKAMSVNTGESILNKSNVDEISEAVVNNSDALLEKVDHEIILDQGFVYEKHCRKVVDVNDEIEVNNVPVELNETVIHKLSSDKLKIDENNNDSSFSCDSKIATMPHVLVTNSDDSYNRKNDSTELIDHVRGNDFIVDAVQSHSDAKIDNSEENKRDSNVNQDQLGSVLSADLRSIKENVISEIPNKQRKDCPICNDQIMQACSNDESNKFEQKDIPASQNDAINDNLMKRDNVPPQTNMLPSECSLVTEYEGVKGCDAPMMQENQTKDGFTEMINVELNQEENRSKLDTTEDRSIELSNDLNHDKNMESEKPNASWIDHFSLDISNYGRESEQSKDIISESETLHSSLPRNDDVTYTRQANGENLAPMQSKSDMNCQSTNMTLAINHPVVNIDYASESDNDEKANTDTFGSKDDSFGDIAVLENNEDKQNADICNNTQSALQPSSPTHLLKRHSMPNKASASSRRGSDVPVEVSNGDGIHGESRRVSLPNLAKDSLRRRLSSISNISDGLSLQRMNELLANELIDLKNSKLKATIASLYDESDSDEDFDGNEPGSSSRKPIDISSKSGMDAFKFFLIDTPGEKLFLLWVEIERLKNCDDKDENRILQEIRQRFFRSGAPHELAVETQRKWRIANISEVNTEKLFNIQEQVLDPLKLYWCARFTMHQKLKHKLSTTDYISESHSCSKSKCSTHQREMTRLPQRPNTCFPHLRLANSNRSKKEDDRPSTSAMSRRSSSSSTVEEISRTRARIRSKSAYPRLISTSNPKDINLSQKQLQIITTLDEGCGYNGIPIYSYKNDASNSDYKSNIRLYIQPMPPSNTKASTLIRSDSEAGNLDEDSDKIAMEALVECLLHEKHSGNFFHGHLETINNELWLNCYHFWKALQDYTEHFFTESFSPALIKQKAGFIYSNFIVSNSRQSINCSLEMQEKIHQMLDPAYEELFDEAEEHALRTLLVAFNDMFGEESDNYNQLAKTEKLKYLDVRTRIRRPKYKPIEKAQDDEPEEEDCREKISPEEVNSPLPVATDGVTFDSFIRDKTQTESFKEFLRNTNTKGLQDLLAWTEMENFRRGSQRHNQRNVAAKSVKGNWFTNEYFFGPISPATKEAQEQIRNMSSEPEIPERPPSPMILEAQKYVRARIERRWFILYKETNTYIERHKASHVTEMVEDMIMKRRLQRSEAAWKILNSRWVSGSRDVVALRQCLLDPQKSFQFRKFLSLKGELMDRNVHFWLEVQKYKDLCHRHVEDSIIKSKVQAIIDVFIKSSVPPELQIDVPIEIAERLHDKACGRSPQHGPYLFREAQTTVFRIMFNHWKEFIAFRASIEDGKLTQHLEELDKKHKAQLKAKKMIAERRRLARAAYDKRRKENEEQQREKERQKMMARTDVSSSYGFEKAASLISEEDETVMQTKSFTFSKFTVEKELKSFEERMREQGYTVDELTEGDLTQSYFTSERRTNRRTSALLSDDQRSVSGLSVRRGRRASDIFSKVTRKDSIFHEPIPESSEDNPENDEVRTDKPVHRLSAGSVNTTASSAKMRRTQSHDKKAIERRVSVKKETVSGMLLVQKNKSEDTVSVGRISSVTDLEKLKRTRRAIVMPGPQRSVKTGVVLTTKSLKAFNKTPEGKQLGVPLPLIHVTNSSNANVPPDNNNECSRPASGKSKFSLKSRKPPSTPRISTASKLNANRKKTINETENSGSSLIADIIVC